MTTPLAVIPVPMPTAVGIPPQAAQAIGKLMTVPVAMAFKIPRAAPILVTPPTAPPTPAVKKKRPAAPPAEPLAKRQNKRPGHWCLDCSTRASMNYPGEARAIYCKEHRLLGMKDVRTKKCEDAKCDTCPSFNYHDQRGLRFCAKHALPGMVNMRKGL